MIRFLVIVLLGTFVSSRASAQSAGVTATRVLNGAVLSPNATLNLGDVSVDMRGLTLPSISPQLVYFSGLVFRPSQSTPALGV